MIPKSLVEEMLDKASGTRFFDIPINDLTREELIAMAIMGWEGSDQLREMASNERKFWLSLVKAVNQ